MNQDLETERQARLWRNSAVLFEDCVPKPVIGKIAIGVIPGVRDFALVRRNTDDVNAFDYCLVRFPDDGEAVQVSRSKQPSLHADLGLLIHATSWPVRLAEWREIEPNENFDPWSDPGALMH